MPVKISVVVTCLNEVQHIGPCIESLLSQTYQEKEIIIVDGGSTDGTAEAIQKYAVQTSSLIYVSESTPGTAAGRNAGLKAATHDFVAFIDADCVAPPDWLAVLVAWYTKLAASHKNIVAVGGTNLPPEDATAFVQAIGVAQDSFFGSFNAHGRRFTENRSVETLSNCNILYDKKKILSVGGYDNLLKSEAEDADLNHRLRKKGFLFFFIPDSFVWHHMRATARLWMKNMFRYGKGRARLLKRYPNMWKVTYTLPLFFLLSMALVPLAVFSPCFTLPLVYFPAVILLSLFQCLRYKKTALFSAVLTVYLIQHFAYAAGEFWELARKDS